MWSSLLKCLFLYVWTGSRLDLDIESSRKSALLVLISVIQPWKNISQNQYGNLMRNGTFTLLLGIKSQYDAWQSSKARRLDRVLGKLFRYTKKNYKQKHRAQTEGKTIEKKNNLRNRVHTNFKSTETEWEHKCILYAVNFHKRPHSLSSTNQCIVQMDVTFS